MASQPVGPGEAPSRMLQLLNSFVTVQALHVAAALGIPDLLVDGPMALDDLAAATGTHAPSLYRLLRMLTGAEVFREKAHGRFALAALGGTLRSEGADSVRDWALFVGGPEMWGTWGGLRDSVRTGEAAFPRAHGMSLWDYKVDHPEVGMPFDRWMSLVSRTSTTPPSSLPTTSHRSASWPTSGVARARPSPRSCGPPRRSGASCSTCRTSWPPPPRSKQPAWRTAVRSSGATCWRACPRGPTPT